MSGNLRRQFMIRILYVWQICLCVLIPPSDGTLNRSGRSAVALGVYCILLMKAKNSKERDGQGSMRGGERLGIAKTSSRDINQT